MLSSPNGPSTTPTRRVPSHPGSEENMPSGGTPPERRGITQPIKMHCMQTLCCCLSRSRHHYWEWASSGWFTKNHSLRYRHDQVHLLWILPRCLPRWCYRGRTQLRKRNNQSRGALLWQTTPPRQWRPMGTPTCSQHWVSNPPLLIPGPNIPHFS